MPKTRKLYYDKVGVVIFARSRRMKRMTISVAPYRPVRVNFPPHVALERAQKYLESNLSWVIERVESNAELERKQHEVFSKTAKPLDVELEAKRLYNKLCKLADLHGYAFNKVTFRNQKTRWGSCSCQDNISLNIHLARLPEHLSDYVLLHELAHTKVKNHSKDFWEHLDTVTNMKARQLDKELNGYTIPRPGHHMRLKNHTAGIEK